MRYIVYIVIRGGNELKRMERILVLRVVSSLGEKLWVKEEDRYGRIYSDVTAEINMNVIEAEVVRGKAGRDAPGLYRILSCRANAGFEAIWGMMTQRHNKNTAFGKVYPRHPVYDRLMQGKTRSRKSESKKSQKFGNERVELSPWIFECKLCSIFSLQFLNPGFVQYALKIW